MTKPYRAIIDILNRYEPTDGAIFLALTQLNTYTTDPRHDIIFDKLCEFLDTRRICFLDEVRELCRLEICRFVLNAQPLNKNE